MVENKAAEMQQVVLEALEGDLRGAELQLALFSAALISYRKDSCLRPFPDFLRDGPEENQGKNMELLEHLLECIPPLADVKAKKAVLSDDCWRLLHWIIKNKIFTVNSCSKNVLEDIKQKTGESSFSIVPDYVFEVSYHTNASQAFDASVHKYGVKYGYHGSRMDNFYSIVSNGLQVHLMKNGLFGDGIYLSEDLAVTMPYVSGGGLWKHSTLGTQASCVAVCEILDHPGVKYQVQNDQVKNRSTAKNSELGEVPDKYFVVTSSNLVRIKYLLMFLERTPVRRKKRQSWICFRYPVASTLIVYSIFLFLMGIWNSRTVQRLWRQRWRANSPDVE